MVCPVGTVRRAQATPNRAVRSCKPMSTARRAQTRGHRGAMADDRRGHVPLTRIPENRRLDGMALSRCPPPIPGSASQSDTPRIFRSRCWDLVPDQLTRNCFKHQVIGVYASGYRPGAPCPGSRDPPWRGTSSAVALKFRCGYAPGEAAHCADAAAIRSRNQT